VGGLEALAWLEFRLSFVSAFGFGVAALLLMLETMNIVLEVLSREVMLGVSACVHVFAWVSGPLAL
tara:strand:- start:14553 stop:14750 length:198 start_codon:yes stop_codon:yes gene_type:complete